MRASPTRQPGQTARGLVKPLQSAGLSIRAKTTGEDERGNAERRARFVGLWPPMLWLIGDSLTRIE